MKNKLMICLLLACASSSGQFAPIGTTWHYSYVGGDHMLNENPAIFPHKYEYLKVEKDTLVQGKIYSKIVGNTHFTDGAYLLRNDSGKVYYYWHNRECFLMDFNAKAKDTLVLDVFVRGRKVNAVGFDTTFYSLQNKSVIIDSISYIQNAISNEKLKTIHFHYNIDSTEISFLYKPNPFYSKFTEKIISDKQDQSKFFMGIPVNILFASNDICTLRCFTSDTYTFTSEWWKKNWMEKYGAACDDQSITTSFEEKNKNDVNLVMYPNPLKNELNIRTNEDSTFVSIYTVKGELVFQTYLKQKGEHRLSLQMASGVFVVRTVSPNSIAHIRLVKE